MNLNRRQFLSLSGIALFSRPVFAQSKPRVIVAGAGLAGLSAAYELSQLGFQVTVIEGRDRIGGRVFTLKKPFVDGQFVELGGELIGDGYKRMLGYAQKFKIPVEEIPSEFETGGSVSNLQGGIGTTAILKGKLYPIGSTLEPHPYNLQGDEAKVLPPTLLSRHLRFIARDVAGNADKIAELDKISLADTLRARGASETAIKLMNISLNYNSIETVSTGGIMFESQRRIGAGTKAMRIIGGNYEIPKALAENAEKNGAKFILSAKIKQISHTPNSVKLSYQDKKGKINTIEADKLVCTIPYSVLREIRFSPTLPEAKAKAINELAYTQITKVFMQGSRFEWDRRNLGTSIWTDSPLERIFNGSGQRGDVRGIFTVWTEGEGGLITAKMSDAARQKWARIELEKALPFMKGAIERTQTKSWTNDEFTRGAYSHFTKGQLTALKPHLKTAVGAIHFAGEHTAENAPGMEGALESAERVVAEIATSKK
jgi:monoamine oxidase